jgi:hypothetical protein
MTRVIVCGNATLRACRALGMLIGYESGRGSASFCTELERRRLMRFRQWFSLSMHLESSNIGALAAWNVSQEVAAF